jgi:hypothetical protein
MAKPSKAFLGTVGHHACDECVEKKVPCLIRWKGRTGTTLPSFTWRPFRIAFLPSLLLGEIWHTGSSPESLFSDYFMDPVRHPLPRSRTSLSPCPSYDALQIDLSPSLVPDIQLSMFPLVFVLLEHPHQTMFSSMMCFKTGDLTPISDTVLLGFVPEG